MTEALLRGSRAAASPFGGGPGRSAHTAPTLLFDVYGTLGDPRGLADALAAVTQDAERIARSWRTHQLQISWLLSLMERYEDFEAVSTYALETAFAEAGLELTSAMRREALSGLQSLALYDDVAPALERLEAKGCVLAVLSNGSPPMLESLLRSAGIQDRFEHVISVDEVRVFKPAPAVYRHAAARLGRPIDRLWLVSGNPFDAAGAKAAGMRVAKVERAPSFRYPFAAPPDLVVATLLELPDAIGSGNAEEVVR